MKQTTSSRRRRWFFARSMARAYQEWLEKRTRNGSRSRTNAVKAKSRPLFAEALEPRVLFSGVPVPVEQAEEQNVDSQQVIAAQTSELMESDMEKLGGFSIEDGAETDFSEEDLERLANEAVARWEKSGLSAKQIEALEQISYVVTDLEGSALAYAEGNSIYIDDDGAGYDWFIDDTEWLDEEFVKIDGLLRAASGADIDGLAGDGIDMLSVLMHEQGHILGLLDEYELGLRDSSMYGIFEEGERRILAEGQADGAVALSLEGRHFSHANTLGQVIVSSQLDWNAYALGLGATPATGELQEVIFDGAGTINVTGNVMVGAIHFKTATTLSGGTITLAGAVNGAIEADADSTINSVLAGTVGLTKTGEGTLTLSGANTYAGTTTISDGVLKLGNNSALGDETGKTVVENGASLDIAGFKGGNTSNELVEIEGAGFGGQGALMNSGGQQTAAFRRITLTDDATISSDTTRWDISGTMDMGGNTLTKIGSSSFYLKNLVITNPGSVDIKNGTLVLEATTDFDGSGAITVRSGATLLLNKSVGNGATPISHDVGLVLENGSTLKADTFLGGVVSPTIAGDVILVGGTATIHTDTGSESSISNLVLSGDISGAGSIRKIGTEILTLSGSNTYAGTTTVSNGTLQMDGTHAGGDSYSVASGATLSGVGSITLASGKSVSTTGTGSVSAGVNGVGTLNVSGDDTDPSGTNTVNLSGNFELDIDGANADSLAVTGTVTLGGDISFNVITNPTASLFKIVDNDAVEAVSGIFSGYAEGSVITLGGETYKIFYQGGDGNDVVLVNATTPTIVYVDDAWASGVNNGQIVADADSGTTGNQDAVFGINAFATLADALAAVSVTGTIVVNAGDYDETVNITGGRMLEITGLDSPGTVEIQSLSSDSSSFIVIEGGSTLVVETGDIDGVISGDGNLVKEGALFSAYSDFERRQYLRRDNDSESRHSSDRALQCSRSNRSRRQDDH